MRRTWKYLDNNTTQMSMPTTMPLSRGTFGARSEQGLPVHTALAQDMKVLVSTPLVSMSKCPLSHADIEDHRTRPSRESRDAAIPSLPPTRQSGRPFANGAASCFFLETGDDRGHGKAFFDHRGPSRASAMSRRPVPRPAACTWLEHGACVSASSAPGAGSVLLLGLHRSGPSFPSINLIGSGNVS